MYKLEDILSGGDLRSKGDTDGLIKQIVDQKSFDRLFKCLSHNKSRIVVMRAADCIEKVTREHPEFLDKHKNTLFELSATATNKELVWHLAQLLPRLRLSQAQLTKIWTILETWALDKTNSRIVRVNSLQGLADISKQHVEAKKQFEKVVAQVGREDIPSLMARIKKIKAEA